jgi:flavin-dependent dehydrogenase
MRPARVTHDLVVVGGGPVGLATALFATGCGLDVVVLEPRLGQVDKACGEGLMPVGAAALADLDVHPAGRPFLGIRYLGGGRSADAPFPGRPGLGVRRTTLHAALRTRVEQAGIEVLPLAAAAPTTHSDQGPDDSRSSGGGHVSVPTTAARGAAGPVLRSRYLVAADGLHSPTRRALGLAAAAREPWLIGQSHHGRSHHEQSHHEQRRYEFRRYGQRRHFTMAPWTDRVEVHWGPSAEVYVTPVSDDLVAVAVLSAQRASFAVQLADFAELRERLEAAPPASDVRGAGPLRQRSSARVAGRVLLVGDASGYVDALTGEGISLGLAQARAAVQAVAAGTPQAYERSWRRLTWEHTTLTQGLVQITRPAWGRRLIVPAAAALPGVFTAVVRRLAAER